MSNQSETAPGPSPGGRRQGGMPQGERLEGERLEGGPPQGSGPEETDFGFRRVKQADKKPMVRAVFDSVAPKYDVMNDVMSLGIHRVWKRIFATRLRPARHRTLLDLASGTGDIACAWRRLGGGPVIATDINAAMLAVGRDRAIGRGLAEDFTYLVADAEALPFRSGTADAVTIAFGLRNCTDKMAVLREARRVLKPGGRFFCLEFSRLQIAVLDPLYEAWSFKVLPRAGRLIAGDAGSYQYLAESIRMFPDQETLAGMMREAGLDQVRFENLSGGIAAIHSGWRL
jgi:demethylmenaquinone methyltransferase/2-methoxy-6-polyprenyl-1,4-benzoquinol methylase